MSGEKVSEIILYFGVEVQIGMDKFIEFQKHWLLDRRDDSNLNRFCLTAHRAFELLNVWVLDSARVLLVTWDVTALPP